MPSTFIEVTKKIMMTKYPEFDFFQAVIKTIGKVYQVLTTTYMFEELKNRPKRNKHLFVSDHRACGPC